MSESATVAASTTANANEIAELQKQIQRIQEAGVAPGLQGDVQAMLQKIAQLQQQNEQLKNQVQEKEARVNQLTQKTQEEMMAKLKTTIAPWIEAMNTLDEAKRKEFTQGLERLVDTTADDSGIWRVVCCASEAHQQNVTELETLRNETNKLREQINNSVNGGPFGTEDARVDKKRKSDVISADEEKNAAATGMWAEMEIMMKKENGISVK